MRNRAAGLSLFLIVTLTAEPAVARTSCCDDADATRATMTSAVATAVPLLAGGAFAYVDSDAAALTLLSAGYLVGPAVGYFTSGNTERGLIGMLVRASAVAGMVGIVFVCYTDCKEYAVPLLAFMTMGGVGLVSVVYDIARVDDFVRARGLPDSRVMPYVDGDGHVGLLLRAAIP